MADEQTITFAQFRQLALESADPETGRVVFPQLRDWHAEAGWVLTMYWHGLIERTGPEPRQWQKTGPWVITETGRRVLAAMDVPTPAHTCAMAGTQGGACEKHCGDQERCWGNGGMQAPRKAQEWTDPEKEPRFQPGEET